MTRLKADQEQKERRKAYDRNDALLKLEAKAKITRFDEELKASLDRIEDICAQASKESENVILDITSFPKRWFFPMMRYLIEDPDIKNLQVAYTRGDEHAESLSENPETLRVIPSFVSLDDRTSHDVAFVGVGFHTHSLLELFGEDKSKSLQLMFPFPPGPPGIHRNWKFVQEVEMKVQKDESLSEDADPINYLHLDATDVSQAFDALKIVTSNGTKTSVMAPYGPKPFSLAMCLFAIACERAGQPEIPMWYSQPQKYAVEYTKDAAYRRDQIDTWLYGIRRDGSFLYEL
ncbi:MAG: hypothetical protein GVY36_16245 [Verrucomicrobia bacterium]|jgi:hypothetical protein|nr:hypothetical protein [Verrucomicrobiota bacterium]